MIIYLRGRIPSKQLCNFLIEGETGAGKSTFLNLLLKTSNLLTVKAICCTSVITRVSYGERIGAQILYESGKKEDVNLDSNKPPAEQLEKVLFQRDLSIREMADDTADKIAEVNLKIPSDILKVSFCSFYCHAFKNTIKVINSKNNLFLC